MSKINYYKKAPTWLHNLNGEAKLFETQDAVDKAWTEGWFGPPWLVQNAPLISQMDWPSNAAMVDAVGDDPRYEGLVLNKKNNKATLTGKIVDFEMENEISDFDIVDPEED